MRMARWASMTAAVTVAVAISAGTGFGIASASTNAAAKPKAVVGVTAGKVYKASWQGDFTYDVPTDTGTLFFHYSCPGKYTAVSGSYHDSSNVGAPELYGNYPRTDVTPLYNQWSWLFSWPSGSPSGYTIVFDLYCAKG
jgi:hypothetical protein